MWWRRHGENFMFGLAATSAVSIVALIIVAIFT
jgi:hypothetical protein